MDKLEKLGELKRRTEEADLPLKNKATNIVFGKGSPNADILFIGEAPGRMEDLEGMPFVGKSGKDLDKYLNSVGLTLEDVYIANILKYRPPENRNPNMDEIITHTPFLIEQIKIIQPKVICTLGNFATKFVLSGFDPIKMNSIEGISLLHGKPKEVEVDHGKFTVFPLYHPAAIIYNRSLAEDMESDFKILKGLL